jgi:2-polyprenyl-3-methyl-5-hydroxy-6-metoxy-1,4-benzoquinol methylase
MKNDNLLYQGLGMPIEGLRRKAFNELNELVYIGKIKIEPVLQCFCNKTDFKILNRFDRFGLPFGTQICRNCGLISQTIRMSEDSLSFFYEDFYWLLIMGTYDTSEHYTVSSSPSLFIDFLKEQIDVNDNSLTVGEIGCGNGIRLDSFSNSLGSQYRLNLFGCDYSKSVLDLAKEKGITTFHGGMESLFTKAPFDILILSHVFEHFIDLKKSLKLIDQLTHEQSLIYVEVPGVVDLVNKPEYMYDYQDYTVLAHIYNFSLSTLSNIFLTQGFKLVKGTEFVRAVFQKNVESPQSVSFNPYSEIMAALLKAREKHSHQMKKSNSPALKYAKGLVKAVLGRV